MALDDIKDSDDYGMQADQNAKIKKVVLIVLAVLLVICAFFFAFYQTIYKKQNLSNANYKILEETEDEGVVNLVFYELPEITVNLMEENDGESKPNLNVKLVFEFHEEASVAHFNKISSKISDAIIFMLSNLKPSEINTPKGMFWLKEEILHRANLLANPLIINNVSFEKFSLKGGQYLEGAK